MQDQAHQVQLLREAMYRLEQKMTETKSKVDLLIAQHRRARLALKAGTASLNAFETDAKFDRIQNKVSDADSIGLGTFNVSQADAEQRLDALDKAGQVDRLLEDLKRKSPRSVSLDNRPFAITAHRKSETES